VPSNPGKYVPSAASTATGGPTDIWGLGDQAKSTLFVGATTPGALGTGAAGERLARANDQQTSDPNAPNYYDRGHNVYKSAEDAMAELPKLYASDRAKYIALQQRLYDAGFYGSASPNSIGLGAYTAQTVNAYRAAVMAATQAYASGTPTTFEEILSQQDPAAAARKEAAGRKAIVPGFVAQYSDPETVAAIAQRAAQEALGRNLSTAEVTAYVKEFHAAEQKWNANVKSSQQTAGKGHDTAVQTAPSAEATAQEFTHRGPRGVEAGGNKMADYVNVLRGMVGGEGL
jgi:hypothetical protein